MRVSYNPKDGYIHGIILLGHNPEPACFCDKHTGTKSCKIVEDNLEVCHGWYKYKYLKDEFLPRNEVEMLVQCNKPKIENDMYDSFEIKKNETANITILFMKDNTAFSPSGTLKIKPLRGTVNIRKFNLQKDKTSVNFTWKAIDETIDVKIKCYLYHDNMKLKKSFFMNVT